MQHLVIGDETVFVYIVQLKRPWMFQKGQMGLSNEAGEVRTLELLVQSSATRDAESTDELFKVNGTIFVLVKDVEDIVCKVSWISEREELLIYTTEFGLV